ncbi:hypothetical protein NM688_g1556 [Phlebia brevispora]|uniref:Uncharacterized protein n=1 Tax=Phlebia brevispora TaxID=194682 RepID=A0ACC1TAY5_9APHY|nr:hypothetical protein NM688_g1556 [Phlebia brevispora]
MITQRITLHEFAQCSQTLTAMHDKTSSWLGLGSSLQTLVRQRKLSTDFLGIAMITLYLLLIFVVHTTLPGTFSVTMQNITTFATYSTVLARQTEPNSTSEGSFGDPDTYSILSVYDTLDFAPLGLSSNTLYDVIPAVENATGAGVEVNATTFSVDCAPLSDVIQTGFWSHENSSFGFPLYEYAFDNNSFESMLYPMGYNQIQIGTMNGTQPNLNTSSWPSMIVVASTYSMVDSAGVPAPAMQMNPMWIVDPEIFPDPRSSPYEKSINVTFLGCNFATENSTVIVNSRTRTIDSPPVPPASVRWHEWTSPGPSSDPMLFDSLQSFTTLVPNAPESSNAEVLLIYNSTYNETGLDNAMTIVDWFISMDMQSLHPNATTLPTEPEEIAVGDLNWSLGRAYAAVWYYFNMATSPSAELNKAQGQASIPSSSLQERLLVNKFPLFTGLVASCMLFVLTMVMTAKSGGFARDTVHHDVSGLLPILWLLGNEPRFAGLEEPDLDALRAAGMQIMTRIEGLHRRAHTMNGKAKDESGEEYELEDSLLKSARSSVPLYTRIETATSESTAKFDYFHFSAWTHLPGILEAAEVCDTGPLFRRWITRRPVRTVHFESTVERIQSYFAGPEVALTIALCIALHAILVFIYAAILATYKAGVYDRPLSLSHDTVHTAITVVTQPFTIVYCAVLVLLTQGITMHEFIERPQTLTAIHDKSSSWLGLGASLQTLARQRKLATDVLGVSMITLYLLLIFVVHTTLPSIFGVTTLSVTSSATYPTTLARLPSGSNWDLESDDYSILQVYDWLDVSTLGVLDNMLYDIIPVVENVTDVEIKVNATTFSVDCAPISDIIQTNFSNPDGNLSHSPDGSFISSSDGNVEYSFTFGGGKYGVRLSPMEQFQLQSVYPAEDPWGSLSNMLVVASTYPLIDSAGDQAAAVSINPMWVVPYEEYPLQNLVNVSILGCNFAARNSTVNVNSRSRSVNGSSAPSPSVRWHERADPGTSSDPILSNTLSNFLSDAPTSISTGPAEVTMYNSSYNVNYETDPPSIIEWFLTMDIEASKNASVGSDTGPTTVGELNWSLGRAYTAVLWYFTDNSMKIKYAGVNETMPSYGQATIPSSALQERLTINRIPLYIGLGAAGLLFILVIVMIARYGDLTGNAVDYDISGLLQVLWLLGNEPRLAAVQEPDLDALRAAGMQVMTTIENLRRRAKATKGKETEDPGEEYELEDPLLKSPRSSDPLVTRFESITSESTTVQFR